ncbi:hypothetical protein [Marinobacter nauticus]|uniref:Uncharacterized protein n=1 Tax=Marinobacter nauticus TaxID=2743 RepID=A0A833JQE7_MARNT|nr:hypothetical protein [Marinobacter nauticus]KAE8546184.1 hypothetical protein F6453_1430 [Marinobacter nauticus]
MAYSFIKVHGESPFVIACDGKYQEQLAYQRLDRDPFSYSKITTVNSEHGLPEITLNAFLRLHTN